MKIHAVTTARCASSTAPCNGQVLCQEGDRRGYAGNNLEFGCSEGRGTSPAKIWG